MQMRHEFSYGDVTIEVFQRVCDGEQYHLKTDDGGTEWLFTICTLDGTRYLQAYIRNVYEGPLEYTPWWQPLDTLTLDPAVCDVETAADFAAWMLKGYSFERAMYNVTVQLDKPTW